MSARESLVVRIAEWSRGREDRALSIGATVVAVSVGAIAIAVIAFTPRPYPLPCPPPAGPAHAGAARTDYALMAASAGYVAAPSCGTALCTWGAP